MKKFKNTLIKFLGGHTKKEYNQVEKKYQALLDSKTSSEVVTIVNEYIYRSLKALDDFARNELYGIASDSWSRRMYNVIHNNGMRLLVRYLNMRSSIIYNIDTNLDREEALSHLFNGEKEGYVSIEELERKIYKEKFLSKIKNVIDDPEIINKIESVL